MQYRTRTHTGVLAQAQICTYILTTARQKSFKQLLDKYKKANTDDKVELPRNFFENVCKIEVMCFNLEADEEEGLDSAAQFNATLDAIKMDIEKGNGKPFNFRPTFREQQAMARKRAQEEQQERERVRAAEEAEAKRKAQEREQNELEEKRRLDEVARQELEVLEVSRTCMFACRHRNTDIFMRIRVKMYVFA